MKTGIVKFLGLVAVVFGLSACGNQNQCPQGTVFMNGQCQSQFNQFNNGMNGWGQGWNQNGWGQGFNQCGPGMVMRPMQNGMWGVPQQAGGMVCLQMCPNNSQLGYNPSTGQCI